VTEKQTLAAPSVLADVLGAIEVYAQNTGKTLAASQRQFEDSFAEFARARRRLLATESLPPSNLGLETQLDLGWAAD
jgi:hypothetical protein